MMLTTGKYHSILLSRWRQGIPIQGGIQRESVRLRQISRPSSAFREKDRKEMKKAWILRAHIRGDMPKRVASQQTRPVNKGRSGRC